MYVILMNELSVLILILLPECKWSIV